MKNLIKLTNFFTELGTACYFEELYSAGFPKLFYERTTKTISKTHRTTSA